MKITAIKVYQIQIPFRPLGSRWIGRDQPSHLDSTVVALETDQKLTGYGESCPLGAVYLPAFANGLRAGIGEMAPALLGQDPTDIGRVYAIMNRALFGHGYAKAAIDIACWDLLGKFTRLPISHLLGGRFIREVPVYASIPLDTPEKMSRTLERKRQDGFRRFQIKVGDHPVEDVNRVRMLLGSRVHAETFMVDANRGWSQADALRIIRALGEVDCYIEQPCETYRECLAVRKHCGHPVILDEVLDTPRDLVRAIEDDALDGMVIKITHAGGITPARILRDLCAAHGIKMRLEDTAGTEFTRAAQAQLAAATPLAQQLGSYTFFTPLPPVAHGAPEYRNGHLIMNNEPGLGIVPDLSRLGDALVVYGEGSG